MILALPAIVCIVGLLMYILAVNPKVQELGRMMFWVGLLVFLMQDNTLSTFVARGGHTG
jgi:hypothetical protein